RGLYRFLARLAVVGGRRPAGSLGPDRGRHLPGRRSHHPAGPARKLTSKFKAPVSPPGKAGPPRALRRRGRASQLQKKGLRSLERRPFGIVSPAAWTGGGGLGGDISSMSVPRAGSPVSAKFFPRLFGACLAGPGRPCLSHVLPTGGQKRSEPGRQAHVLAATSAGRGIMSIGAEVAAHLPFLRRYARALTGSQSTGDAFVHATLEAALADTALAESLR